MLGEIDVRLEQLLDVVDHDLVQVFVRLTVDPKALTESELVRLRFLSDFYGGRCASDGHANARGDGAPMCWQMLSQSFQVTAR